MPRYKKEGLAEKTYRFPVHTGTTGPIIPVGVKALPWSVTLSLSAFFAICALYSTLGFYNLLFWSFYLPNPVRLLGGEIQGGGVGSTSGGVGTTSGGMGTTSGGMGTNEHEWRSQHHIGGWHFKYV